MIDDATLRIERRIQVAVGIVLQCFAVIVLFVRIEVVQTGRLGVQSDAATKGKPLCQFHGHVESRGEGKGLHAAEGLHGGEAHTGGDAQIAALGILPAEGILQISRKLVQAGHLAEGPRTTVTIGTERQQFIVIIITLARIPVVMIVNTHLEALVDAVAFQEEGVVQFEVDVAWAALRIAGSPIGSCEPGNIEVARLAGGDNVDHTLAGGNEGRLGFVDARQRQTEGISQRAREQTVDADFAVVCQREDLIDILRLCAFLLCIRVVAIPVLGIQVA